MGISPIRLNHAVLFVNDLERSVDFYIRVFGMELITRVQRMNAAFLRLPRSGNHHDLGLFGTGYRARSNTDDDVVPPVRPRSGLYHLAWQVDTIDELAAARSILSEAGVLTGQSDHGATKSIYGVDPDGNEFEIMWMLPRHSWGEYESSAVVNHLDLDSEMREWSGVRTASS